MNLFVHLHFNRPASRFPLYDVEYALNSEHEAHLAAMRYHEARYRGMETIPNPRRIRRGHLSGGLSRRVDRLVAVHGT